MAHLGVLYQQSNTTINKIIIKKSRTFMEILKENGAILFKTDEAYYSFPDNTIMIIANDESDAINVRLLGSRKNILTFEYQKVSNLTATSATDLVEQINNL